MTKRQLARRVAVEIRAAELGLDAPRGPAGSDGRYSADEYTGWGLNYWDHAHPMPGSRLRKVQTAGRKLQRAPRNDGEWAGWLAREVFHAVWS